MDDEKYAGRIHGEQPEAEKDSLVARLFHVVIIWVMLSFAQTVLGVLTVIQFVIMAVQKGEPNERLADFGTDLGVWMASIRGFLTTCAPMTWIG